MMLQRKPSPLLRDPTPHQRMILLSPYFSSKQRVLNVTVLATMRLVALPIAGGVRHRSFADSQPPYNLAMPSPTHQLPHSCPLNPSSSPMARHHSFHFTEERRLTPRSIAKSWDAHRNSRDVLVASSNKTSNSHAHSPGQHSREPITLLLQGKNYRK